MRISVKVIRNGVRRRVAATGQLLRDALFGCRADYPYLSFSTIMLIGCPPLFKYAVYSQDHLSVSAYHCFSNNCPNELSQYAFLIPIQIQSIYVHKQLQNVTRHHVANKFILLKLDLQYTPIFAILEDSIPS